MNRRCLTSSTAALPLVLAALCLAPAPAVGQSATSAPGTVGAATAWTAPRTADGQPDLQGIWDFRTITPLQRPAALGDKAFYTEQEAAALGRRLELPAGRCRPL
jgi:hypothetical protein